MFSTMVAVAVALVHTPLVWVFVGGVAAGALADKVSVRRGEIRRERANLEEVQRRRRAEWEARRRANRDRVVTPHLGALTGMSKISERKVK